jgi:hypothetical protein
MDMWLDIYYIPVRNCDNQNQTLFPFHGDGKIFVSYFCLSISIHKYLVAAQVIGCYSQFCLGIAVRMIANDPVIQPLALIRTQWVFFGILSKDHEYGPCRSTALVKPIRPAGVPLPPGAVHEFA